MPAGDDGRDGQLARNRAHLPVLSLLVSLAPELTLQPATQSCTQLIASQTEFQTGDVCKGCGVLLHFVHMQTLSSSTHGLSSG